MRPWRILRIVIGGIVFFTVILLALGFLVMALWNGLIPDLFKGPALTFGQAVGLLLLAHILLRGWTPWRYGNGWRRDRWRRRFEEKLATLAPEEREKFRAAWRGHCGRDTEESKEKPVTSTEPTA